MPPKKFSSNSTEKKSFLHVVSRQSDQLTIKIFDVNGRRAKTIRRNTDLTLGDLDDDIVDLAKGQYVMNAFKGSDFIKSFRFIKD